MVTWAVWLLDSMGHYMVNKIVNLYNLGKIGSKDQFTHHTTILQGMSSENKLSE